MHFHMSVLAITQAPSEQEKRPQTTALGGEIAIHLGLSHLGRTSWRSASPPARQRGVDEAAGLVPMEASFFIIGGKRLRLTS